MRKLRRIAVRTAVVLAIVLGSGAFYLRQAGLPRYEVRAPTLHVAVTPHRLERGKKLVSLLCASCHLDPTTRVLSGTEQRDSPPAFGTIYSSNITGHKEKGIGGWTDGELAYLLRTGVRRDGTYLPPYMIKLPHLSDEDLHAIIAFLRSGDPMVRPADVPSVPSRPSLLVKLLARVSWKPLPYPDKPIVAPSWNDQVAYGRYLTHNLGCVACHSQDFRKLDELHPEKSAGYLGGGNRLLDINGRQIVAPNITFDRETGIGRWTEPQFVRAMREGFRPDGKPIRYPMLPTPELSVDEVRAIYAYLKTVPVIRNPRPPAQELVLTADASEGQRIYFKYACHSCHGLDGVGLADLRPANRKYKHDAQLIAWIKHPSKIKPGTKMPDWEGVIPEAEVKPLVAYVRSLGR